MPQFVVPQFIDVEDKIIGPITTRQFIMGVVATLLIFMAYKLADTALFIIETIFIFAIYVLVGFIKINGQPFMNFVMSMFRSIARASLRVWMKQPNTQSKKPAKNKDKEEDTKVEPVSKPHPKQVALSQLSLLVDTGGKFKPEEVMQKASIKNRKTK